MLKRFSTVTTELDHDLTKNDSISLEIRPSLTSGIGTATAVSVRRDTLRDKNPCRSSWI